MTTQKQQSNKAEYIALGPFKDLYKMSPVIQMAFEFGQQIIPLNAVGMIMNYSGNHLLHYIGTVMHKKIFFPMTTVQSVILMSNGDVVTSAVRKKVEIKPFVREDGQNDYETIIVQEIPVTFRSKAIVMSHGG